MDIFQQMCGFPSVQGAIDGTHIQISKPKTIFLEDYYYHKIKGDSIVAQTIIDY
jgi:hypothetical protein